STRLTHKLLYDAVIKAMLTFELDATYEAVDIYVCYVLNS
ncbi:hypothetical protein LCGC14_1573600, partial [marine sediment metagenome]